MSIKLIRNDDDLTNAFIYLESIFQAEKNTSQAEEMAFLIALIEAYENEHYPINPTSESGKNQ